MYIIKTYVQVILRQRGDMRFIQRGTCAIINCLLIIITYISTY